MRPVWNTLLKGLAAVLPVALTSYLVYWLGISIERGLRPVITVALPEAYYVPGMGLTAGLVLLFLAGLAVNAWIVQRLFRLGDALLERIPLVKSVHGALRDFLGYFSATGQRRDLHQVVMVTLGDARLLGFLTREHVDDVPGGGQHEDIVAVYAPMSYQIGGYTLYLPRSRVERVDMPIEDAMRRVLTAELSKPRARPRPSPAARTS